MTRLATSFTNCSPEDPEGPEGAEGPEGPGGPGGPGGPAKYCLTLPPAFQDK